MIEMADTDRAAYCDAVNREAHRMHSDGWAVFDLPVGAKRPDRSEWQRERLTDDDIDIRWNGSPRNVGVMLGRASGGLVDVDLDCPEAIAAAKHILPATERKHGRPSARASHWWYRVDGRQRTLKLTDPTATKSMVVELRGDGRTDDTILQTVAPPSYHPSGEQLVWECSDDPTEIDGATLERAVYLLGAAVVIGRRWREGTRHDAACALAGWVLRAGMSPDEARRLVSGVCAAAGDTSEMADRVDAVADTAQALDAGQPVTGRPRLATLLGEDGPAVCQRVSEWLALSESSDESRPRFRILSDSDIESIQPPEMLVADTIPAGGLGVLYGQPGSLKTFAALDIALSIQTGRAWCGRPVKQGNILYVVAESGSQFGLRVKAWKAWQQVEGDTGAGWLWGAVQLHSPEDLRAQMSAIQDAAASDLGLVVYDTFARCAVGSEENSATDTGKLIAGCDFIRRETSAAVWLIHHTAKTGLHERGSSALRGAADTMISATADGDFVTLRCEKQKDLEHFENIVLKKRVIELAPDVTSVVLDHASQAEMDAPPVPGGTLKGGARTAFEVLEQAGSVGLSSTEWLRISNLPETTFHRARRNLVEWGYAERRSQKYFTTGVRP